MFGYGGRKEFAMLGVKKNGEGTAYLVGLAKAAAYSALQTELAL